jgi:hypothetical protein
MRRRWTEALARESSRPRSLSRPLPVQASTTICQRLQQSLRTDIPYIVSASRNAVVRSTTKMSFSSTQVSASSEVKECGIVERTIREKLMKSLSPVQHLAIVNESHRHNVYVYTV